MKKQTIVLLLTFCVGFFSYAQKKGDLVKAKNISIKKGEPYPETKKTYPIYLSMNDGTIISVKDKFLPYAYLYGIKVAEPTTVQLTIQVFNDALQMRSSKVVKLERNGSLWGLKKIGDKAYLLYTVKDNKAKKKVLIAKEIDLETAKLSSDKIVLIETKTNFWEDGIFSIDTSRNGQLFAVKYMLPQQLRLKSKVNEEIGIAVFDNSFNKKWESVVKMPYTADKLENLDFTLDKNGNGYFLFKKLEAINFSAKNDPDNYSISIFKVTSNGSVEEKETKLDGHIATSMTIVEADDNTGDILCAGYYKIKKQVNVKGVFTAVLKENGEFSKPQMFDFTIDFVKEYTRVSNLKEQSLERKEEKGKLGLNDLHMERVVKTEDGGLLLFGEVSFIETVMDSKGNIYYRYHYYDMIVTKVKASGELEWMKKVPRRLVSTRRPILDTYKLSVKGGSAFVLFIDNPKNINLAEDTRPAYVGFKHKKQWLIAYKIDLKTGEKQYLPVFSMKAIGETKISKFLLSQIVRLTDGDFVAEAYVGKASNSLFRISIK